MYKDDFSRLHALTLFVYFAVLFTASALTIHPACIGIVMIGVFCYAARLGGAGFLKRSPFFLLPGAAAAAVNVLFNHRGATRLFFLPGGNAVTLEAVLYGAAAAFLVISLCIGFYCFTQVFTTDKLTALFAKAMPGFAVILCMTLRFVPLFVRRFRSINEAQTALGRGAFQGNALRRIKNLARLFSILIGVALEESIITADSMKSRGYGVPGRKSYSAQRFSPADVIVTAASLCCGGFVIACELRGTLDFAFYPRIRPPAGGSGLAAAIALYSLLVALPLIYDIVEEIKWRSRRSEI